MSGSWRMGETPSGIPRFYRDGGWQIRLMRVKGCGNAPAKKEWALYHKGHRVWEVQGCSKSKAAIAQADAWIAYENGGREYV